MKYFQYLAERFPPQQFTLLAGLLAAVAGVCLQAQAYGRVRSFQPILLAFVALLFFLFRLRLFDEIKDYAHDLLFYPDRPLQRGLVSTGDIKRLIVVSLAVEIAVAACAGRLPLAYFAVSLAYSVLMFKEFFAPAWLRQRFTLYIFLHELLAIPLFFYAASMQVPAGRLYADPLAWAVVLFLGFQLFFLEIARKMRPPELENAARDTYTAQYGVGGASILLVVAAAAALKLGLMSCGGSNRYMAALPLFIYFCYSIRVFSRSRDARASKAVFNAAVAYFTLLNAAAIWAALA
ncbi:MAG: UbiA family prenyltransferase [Elusimicrobiota bacterium]|nr:UbiA family prenyltransferase [Elusimicrobiota bacterium]